MLCYNCMREKGDAIVCPYCGAENQPDSASHHLAPGTVIGGRYTLGRVLGEGGFGITYIGFDHVLDALVAVKEFFPYGFSHRVNTVSNTVTVSAGDNADFYEKGKRRFLSEAKNVARFRNEPGIVIVTDFIEENNTAYIIMEYLDGIDLRNYLRRYGAMSVDQTLDLLMPVIKSLNKMHESGIIHRDISPDNLMFMKDGSVKLMDFGAARDFAGDNRSMSVMLKKGYAPEEQYRSNGHQGPWTDVYGMCATIYRCITGKTPVESLDRIFEDPLQKPSELGVMISPDVENVLMYGLAVRSDNRCRNMAELGRLLNEARQKGSRPAASAAPVTAIPVNAAPVSQKPVNTAPITGRPVNPAPVTQRPAGPVPAKPKKSVALPIILGSLAGALVVVIVALLILSPFGSGSSSSASPNAVSSSSSFSLSDLSSAYNSASNEASSQVSSAPSSSAVSSASTSSSSDASDGKGAAKKFTVAETGTAASTFQKTADYTFDLLDLSLYRFNISGTESYPMAASGCYKTDKEKSFFTTDIVHQEGAVYDIETDISIGGKSYTIGTATLKDFLNNGWAYEDSDDKPSANESSGQGVTLVQNGKSMRVYVYNTGSDPEATKIRSFYINGSAGSTSYPDFDYLSLVPTDTMGSVLDKLKTPSNIHMYAGNYSGTVEFTYTASDSNLQFQVEFKYDPTADTAKISQLYVAYRD